MLCYVPEKSIETVSNLTTGVRLEQNHLTTGDRLDTISGCVTNPTQNYFKILKPVNMKSMKTRTLSCEIAHIFATNLYNIINT